jgi:hypothetical protein
MANETVQATGSFATAQAATSTGDGVLCTGSVTAIGTAIATEDLYPLLDFKLTISSGTPVVGGTVDIYRRPSDGTNQSPAPVYTDFLTNYVGSITLDDTAATSYYYLYGVANPDPGDTYYMVNESGATLTIALSVRGRTYGN